MATQGAQIQGAHLVIPRPPDAAFRAPPRRRPRCGWRDRRLGRRAGLGAQPPPARTRPHHHPLWYGPLRAAVLERAEGEAYEGAQTGSPCPGPAKSTIDAIPNALGLESHLKSKDQPAPLVTAAMPAQAGGRIPDIRADLIQVGQFLREERLFALADKMVDGLNNYVHKDMDESRKVHGGRTLALSMKVDKLANDNDMLRTKLHRMGASI